MAEIVSQHKKSQKLQIRYHVSYSILFDSCQRGNNEDLNLLWFLIAAAVQQNQLCGVLVQNKWDIEGSRNGECGKEVTVVLDSFV